MKTKLISLIIFLTGIVYPQNDALIENYRNDNYGNIQYRREGILNGNNIRTLFYNEGQVGHWPYQPSGEWPKGSGQTYLDGMCLLIGAEVTVPDTSNPGEQIRFHSIATYYREWMDRDPITGEIWGLMPLPGYYSQNSETPAMSNNPSSWPESWPEALDGSDNYWPGQWHGYLGNDKILADLESFYVMDDSKDKEYTKPPFNFYPVENDSNRAGLGLRVESRVMQFANALVSDVIFLQHKAINISDYRYNLAAIGFYVDPGVGGTNDTFDDNASYEKENNIVYAFDSDGLGIPGEYQTGYLGYALLGTPGNAENMLDDDNDGLIDETQDDGMDNDGDWRMYGDNNGNGMWDSGEPLNDDVGVDGLAPGDESYAGPDNGEGDGIPTIGEPNFETRDIDEIDQVGLSSVSVYRLGEGGSGGGWPKDDESLWLKMISGFTDGVQNSNISMVFGSGPFPFPRGQIQKLAAAMILGDDLEKLIMKAELADFIYKNEFSHPDYSSNPGTIGVTITSPVEASEISGTVNITWDSGSQQNATADLFLSSDGASWIHIGTDIYNSESFVWDTRLYPDGVFNKIRVLVLGNTEFGIKESDGYFTINNAENAPPQVLVLSPGPEEEVSEAVTINWISGDAEGDSYTIGIKYKTHLSGEWEEIISGIPSTTNSYTWNSRLAANTPSAVICISAATGVQEFEYYSQPFIIDNYRDVYSGEEYFYDNRTNGTGFINLVAANPSDISGDNYLIEFLNQQDEIPAYRLTNISSNIVVFDSLQIINHEEGPYFDGLRLLIDNDDIQGIMVGETGWLVGESNLSIIVLQDESSPARNVYSPYDFEIHFYDENVYETPFFRIPANMLIFNTTKNDTIDYEIFDNDGDGSFSIGDDMIFIEDYGGPDYKLSWRIEFGPPPGIGYTPIMPAAGDIFKITPHKPFMAPDSVYFRTGSLVGIQEHGTNQVEKYKLSQNYPNPFNPVTTISFQIPQAGIVNLKVFDILGREVITLANGFRQSGVYKIEFDAGNLPSGVYFYKLRAGDFTAAKKLIVLK